MTVRMSRRAFLENAAAAGITVGSGLTTAFAGGAARAADTSGYKALVCVFFKGGIDCHDVMLPYDQASYDRYAQIRSNLMQRYDAIPGGSTRVRNRLLELDAVNNDSFGGRRFALTEEMAPVHDLFTRGKASIVANVGPLLEPTTRTTYRDRSVARPPRLFSHNDQQSTWMALSPEGQRFGWGGRMADIALNANANVNPVFTAISVSGNEVFLSGERAVQYQIGSNGAQTISEMTNRRLLGSGRDSATAAALIDEHFRADTISASNLFGRDLLTVQQRAIRANDLYNESTSSATELTTAFPDTGLGKQLSRVAQTIGIRNNLNVSRQIFYVSIGGFDSHSNQANSIPNKQREISGGIAAFYAALEEMGIANDVTLFTASDFGRTLVINGDGTDHGWGGHHLIVGGAVNGRSIFGSPPPAEVDHEADSGRGRLIPTTSIEQFAYPMGRWFGLSDAEMRTVLPRLSAFAPPQALV